MGTNPSFETDGKLLSLLTGPSLIVDTTPPTLTLSSETAKAFQDGLIGPNDIELSGDLFDNHLVSYVEVCEDNVCERAEMQVSLDNLPQTSFSYRDEPASPLIIGANHSCEAGTPLMRTFNVTDEFTIADIDVGLNIDHAFRNDLQIALISPAGTRVELVSLGAAANNLDLLLDDAALRTIDKDHDSATHNTGAPYYENIRQPVGGLLHTFRGESATGTWRLEFCDQYAAEDDGLYNHSQLDLQAATIPTNTTATWQYQIKLPQNSSQSEKTLTLYGYDSLGNRSQPITLNFEVDTEAPTINVTNITTQTMQTLPVIASGLVTDTDDVTMRLTMHRPNGELRTDRIDVLENDWSYSNSSHFVLTGTYEVWIEAQDSVGNIAIAGPYPIEIENYTPELYQIWLPLVADDSIEFLWDIYLPVIVKESGLTTNQEN